MLEKIQYAGWSNIYRLSNAKVELYILADVGPRIIHYSWLGQPNQLHQFPSDLGQVGGPKWRSYGGHRLWHAPELFPRTYSPDNNPIEVRQADSVGLVAHTIQPIEPTTGIQKEMIIQLAPDSSQVQITHRLTNEGNWTIELAPWALTVMALDGVAILPLPPRGSHTENLVPSSSLILWAYTHLRDPRWTWGDRYILLRQERTATTPQKVGLSAHCPNWLAYARDGSLFIKTFNAQLNRIYPDMGAAVEVFTNEFMMELETLGPLTSLAPQGYVEHVERWCLFADVIEPTSDAEVEQFIMPKIETALNHS